MSAVGYARHGTIAVLTLQRPERRNVLDTATVDTLIAALARAVDDAARAVVLRAAPAAAVWSAGFDIRALSPGTDPETYDAPVRRAVRAVRDCRVPVIAMVEGGVWGGATELVLSCDLVVAAAGASFALTPARLGVPYSVAGVLNLMHAVGRAVLREMVFTGEPLAAESAAALGIVNRVVPAAELEATTFGLAERIAAAAPHSIAAFKAALNALEHAVQLDPQVRERLEALRRAALESEDYREGIAAFLDKRAPRFEGR